MTKRSASVSARTLTVTTTADRGVGSLRQAIADASTGDTIDVPVSGSISSAAAYG